MTRWIHKSLNHTKVRFIKTLFIEKRFWNFNKLTKCCKIARRWCAKNSKLT